MSEFHSASKLLQDIQIEYTRALDIGILKPVQVHPIAASPHHPQGCCQHSTTNLLGLLAHTISLPPHQVSLPLLAGDANVISPLSSPRRYLFWVET